MRLQTYADAQQLVRTAIYAAANEVCITQVDESASIGVEISV